MTHYHYIFLVFVFILPLGNAISIQATYNLTFEEYTWGSPFVVMGEKVYYQSIMRSIVEVNIENQQLLAQSTIMGGDGFTFFNGSVGALVANEVIDGSEVYSFYLFDASTLAAISSPVIFDWHNDSDIGAMWRTANLSPTEVYAYTWNASVYQDSWIVKVDVTTGVVNNFLAPCATPNQPLSQINSFQILDNGNTMVLLCTARHTRLVTVDLVQWAVVSDIQLDGQASILSLITPSVLGYILFNNTGDYSFHVFAYDLSVNQEVASIPIGPFTGYENSTDVVYMYTNEAGTIFVTSSLFGKPGLDATAVTMLNFENNEFSDMGTLVSKLYDFTVGDFLGNGFVLNETLYVWADSNGGGSQNLILIGH